MADRKIDQAKANAWIKDVKEEINSVEKLLKEVGNVCNEMPGDTDTFVQMLEKTAGYLNTAWDRTTSGFKNAWEKIDDVLKDIGRAGEKVAEKIEEYNRKVKQ